MPRASIPKQLPNPTIMPTTSQRLASSPRRPSRGSSRRRAQEPCPLGNISNNSVRRMRRTPFNTLEVALPEVPLPGGGGGGYRRRRRRLRKQRPAYSTASFWIVAGILTAALGGFAVGKILGTSSAPVPTEEDNDEEEYDGMTLSFTTLGSKRSFLLRASRHTYHKLTSVMPDS